MSLFRSSRQPSPLPPAPPASPSAPLFDLANLRTRTRAENESWMRALASPVFVAQATALCRILGRYKAYVDTRDAGLSAHLLLDGYWEMWVTEAMASAVRPGMHAVDCGANVGYYTLLLADLVGAAGRVTAVEPNARMVGLLRRSLLANGFGSRVTLCDRPAYGRSDVSMVLDVPEDHPQNATLRAPGEGRERTLSTITLDDLVGDAPVDFVKIDVEGAEEQVWAGMAGILRRGAPLTVYLEFNAHRYDAPERFLDEVLSHGFTVASIDAERGVLPVTPEAILARESREDWMLVLTR
ncbi:FkbM family methyltransferase [Roseomonas sp. CCTCC AB2023176]|uniref:FkbM family methyltransferase n=1 Tax=Roseomonas sp. CCTCC AB2023176 TaxID=3342640 RepID=UPI0035DD802E